MSITTSAVAKMLELRKQGKTYAAIADEVGCSKQYVHQLIGKAEPSYFQYITETGCVYPGWRKWMNDNLVSRSEFVRRMGRIAWPNVVKNLSCYMRGDHEPSKSAIDAILAVTGLTYEECFGGREDG